jgi:hypothetical protein
MTTVEMKEMLKKETGLSITVSKDTGLDPSTMQRIEYFVFTSRVDTEYDFTWFRENKSRLGAHYCSNMRRLHIPSKNFIV